MKRHVEFLSWLYLAWGAIFLLMGLAGAALAAGAAAISTATSPVQAASPTAARVTALTLALLAVLALLWAVLHLWVGRSLRSLRARARLLALGLALVNTVLIPFGTALGAYACWVLLKEEVRVLFEN